MCRGVEVEELCWVVVVIFVAITVMGVGVRRMRGVRRDGGYGGAELGVEGVEVGGGCGEEVMAR